MTASERKINSGAFAALCAFSATAPEIAVAARGLGGQAPVFILSPGNGALMRCLTAAKNAALLNGGAEKYRLKRNRCAEIGQA